MLAATIETASSGRPRSAAGDDAAGLTVYAGRRGRVAVVRMRHGLDDAGGDGPWALVDRAVGARVRLVILDVTGRPRGDDGGAVRRLVERLSSHGVRYALVAPAVEHLPDLPPGVPVYPSTAIARGTL